MCMNPVLRKQHLLPIFSELKQSVYEVASTWLIVAGTTSAMVIVAGDFIDHILTDARPRVETIKVTSCFGYSYAVVRLAEMLLIG